MTTFRLALTASAAALLAGCTPTIKTQNEVTVKPIQITLPRIIRGDFRPVKRFAHLSANANRNK